MADRISITRVFAAPREGVWREWTVPERLAGWFGGTESEVPLTSLAMDVRVGGAWRLTTHTRDGMISWHGEYREIVEPDRIAFTLSDQPQAEAEAALVRVELVEAADGRTEMRFAQQGSLSPEQTRAARYAWSRSFDRMAEQLAAG